MGVMKYYNQVAGWHKYTTLTIKKNKIKYHWRVTACEKECRAKIWDNNNNNNIRSPLQCEVRNFGFLYI